jgi:hypothetical protein
LAGLMALQDHGGLVTLFFYLTGLPDESLVHHEEQ